MSGIPCTCRDENKSLFAPLCRAELHHWQVILEEMTHGKIAWREDEEPPQDDSCHCRACRPRGLCG